MSQTLPEILEFAANSGLGTLLDTYKFARIETLGNIICRQTLLVKLPQVIANYDAGKTIRFGLCAVSKQGFTLGSSHLYAWNVVKEVEAGKPYYRPPGRWAERHKVSCNVHSKCTRLSPARQLCVAISQPRLDHFFNSLTISAIQR
jgi:hypothetical protein